MNKKQFAILLALVVVLGAAGLVLYRHNSSSWQSANQSIGKKLLGDLPINDVAAITIKSGTNELNLVKNDNLWCVQERSDYPADYSLISGFLLKAVDLKATQTEEVGPSQLGRFKLLPPGPATNTGSLVEFKDQGGKTLKSLLIGKEHLRKSARPAPGGEFGDQGFPDGRYVMVGVDAKTAALISDPLSSAEAKPEQWLNKDFIKVEKVRSIAVAFPEATNSWRVSRESESGEWKLADAGLDEQLDSAKTGSFATALSSPTFTDVLPAAVKPERTVSNQFTLVALDTFDHFSYTLNVGGKTNDTYRLNVGVAATLPRERTPGADEKPEDKAKLDKEFQDSQTKLADKLKQEQGLTKWTYLVSSWTLDSLLKERAQLLAEKKEEPKKDEAKPAETPAETK